MTNYFKLPTWADKDHVHAVVETPRGSRVKLEFDPKLGAFTLAKPLFAGLKYPYDWGFIPSTQADDGDPLDVLIIRGALSPLGRVPAPTRHLLAKSLIFTNVPKVPRAPSEDALSKCEKPLF
jgi:hypothetical protein